MDWSGHFMRNIYACRQRTWVSSLKEFVWTVLLWTPALFIYISGVALPRSSSPSSFFLAKNPFLRCHICSPASFKMRSSLLLLWAGALILAAANPTPQSGGTFRCPPLASTGDTETPPIIIGDLVIPTVAIDGTDTGGTSRLVCCRAGTAGVLALPSGTCVDGKGHSDDEHASLMKMLMTFTTRFIKPEWNLPAGDSANLLRCSCKIFWPHSSWWCIWWTKLIIFVLPQVLAPPPLPIIGQTGVIYSLCEPPIRG